MKHIEEEWLEVVERAKSLETFFDANAVPECDQNPFAYYNLQAPTNSRPEWTLPFFKEGVLEQGGYGDFDLEKVDGYGELLIPNFRHRAHGLSPVLDAAKPLAEMIIEGMQTGSFLVSSNHPTLPTPILTARAIIEAVKDEIPDIQKRIYITYGMLPVMFEFDFGVAELSPTAFAAGLGNVMVTAAVSDSNTRPELQEWQSLYRDWYKTNVARLLLQKGNFVVTALNGQRDVAFSSFNKSARRIHQPEGDVSAFVQQGVQFINFAVYDRLLEDPLSIASPVEIYANQRIVPVTEDELRNSNKWQKEMLRRTFDGSPYYHEGVTEMGQRVSDRKDEIAAYVASKLDALRSHKPTQ